MRTLLLPHTYRPQDQKSSINNSLGEIIPSPQSQLRPIIHLFARHRMSLRLDQCMQFRKTDMDTSFLKAWFEE